MKEGSEIFKSNKSNVKNGSWIDDADIRNLKTRNFWNSIENIKIRKYERVRNTKGSDIRISEDMTNDLL